MSKTGEITIPVLSNPSPLPLDPNDPIIGAYLSSDESTLSRFYGNGTYIFKSLIHPSTSFGYWNNYGDSHYSLNLYLTDSEGKISYANAMPFNLAQGYDLANGELIGSGSGDHFRKISGNPDQSFQGHAYPSTSPQTPINRQVGVEVRRESPSSISIKIMTGKDVASLVTLHVMANGKEAALTSGKIAPRVGSIAHYAVNANSDVTVVAEFYDYSRYNIWAGTL